MWRWMTFRKGALTTYYPEETRPDYAPRNRGKHVLTQRPDGTAAVHRLQHVRDGLPGQGASRSRPAFDPDDPAHPKYPVRFEIDYSRCVFCGLCVEACPEDAIRMVKEVPAFPGDDRTTCGCRSTSCSTGTRSATSPSPTRTRRAAARAPEAAHDRDTAAPALFAACGARSRRGC